jgi:REP element-mobilizing transposase RayT
VHAYVLMTNDVHLLMTAESDDGISKSMKDLGQRFVLGGSRFEREIAAMLGRRTWKGSPGRPKKPAPDHRQAKLEI